MRRIMWFSAITLPLLAASLASAEITKGVLAIRGAEMS